MINYVDGLDDFFVSDICINKYVNKHSTANVKFFLATQDENNSLQSKLWTGSEGAELSINNGSTVLFKGFVESVSVENLYNQFIIIVNLISYSVLFDDEKFKRVFQSTDKKFSDIFQSIASNSNNSNKANIGIIDDNLKNLEYKPIVVQEDKTNFKFIVKLAKKLGFNVFVNDTNSKSNISFSIGNKINISAEVKSNKIVTISNLKYKDKEIYFIQLKTYHEIGSILKINNIDYIITAIQIILKNNFFYYNYEAYSTLQTKPKTEFSDMKFYNLGNCKIVDRDDEDKLGRLQVEFIDYEDCLKDKPAWISYIPNLTEGDVGVLTYPDKDEIVKVFAQNGDFFVAGCVRQTKINSDLDDTEHRVFKFRDKEIIFKNDLLKITSKDSTIEIDNENNLKIEFKDSIKIDTKDTEFNSTDKIKITSKDTDLDSSDKIKVSTQNTEINSTDKVNVSTKDTTIDTTNGLNVKTQKSNINSSSSFTIKTSSTNVDSNTVKVKTMSFDIS